MQTVFTAERLWDGQRLLEKPLIAVEDGRIASISTRKDNAAPAASDVRDLGDALIGPSFFDVHIHGSAGHDVMEGTEDALAAIGKFLASRGTAQYLATTVTAPLDKTLRSLELLAKLIAAGPKPGQAHPIGIHLEGPFLSHARRGVHPPDLLLAPDIPTFDRMYEAAEGHVRLLTLAPELPGAIEFARHATSKGVRVSIGHSDATSEQTRAAIDAGAASATHTYNAMRPLDHREPGILGIVLTTDTLFAELICDGIHNTPEMVKLWWRAKGPERGILITDAMSAAGMPDGTYQLGGFDVQVAYGRATAHGALAGSVLTLDRALANFVRFTGATVDQGLRLLSSNPAAMTGFSDRAGSVHVGAPASFVAVNPSGSLVASVVDGILLH
ncbi:N-acetylglucosamine-6-phosphate deacetylase [Occallatibacter riparius]|uniref:N-acetylglucosamine-6-phosphate deacetylase n=1 Tax=Occallatibacter riparius TaxID=1002689 RepID=A0A9J7BL27_9BACT|nr:N-acetylglucosamine-6-phosphate deacetylase [Occallatibacter riparius]UWZ83315.1 N-acetylglucosamine-6-phosphate deacetylase [Occallatibacter riparius]